jgi:mono/diheme cytochrome c family protein
MSNTMYTRRLLAAALAVALCGIAQAQDPKAQRGRYMVLTGHCNNCHTAGYAMKEGNVPEKDWLMGSGAQGWRGPWGTTYASNLRVNVHGMSEDDWVKYLKTMKTRPPMPYWSTRETTEEDLRAMHAYIKQLGPAGAPARSYLPPGQEPKPPYIQYPMPKENR